MNIKKDGQSFNDYIITDCVRLCDYEKPIFIIISYEMIMIAESPQMRRSSHPHLNVCTVIILILIHVLIHILVFIKIIAMYTCCFYIDLDNALREIQTTRRQTARGPRLHLKQIRKAFIEYWRRKMNDLNKFIAPAAFSHVSPIWAFILETRGKVIFFVFHKKSI